MSLSSRHLMQLQQIDQFVAQCTDSEKLIELFKLLATDYEEKGRHLEVLLRAAACSERALALTAPDSPKRSFVLSASVSTLHRRYQHAEDPLFLDLAIDRALEAFSSFSGDAEMRCKKVQNVCTLVEERINLAIKNTGPFHVVEELAERAIAEVPDDIPYHPRLLSALSELLQSKFQHDTQDIGSLSKAVLMSEKAVATARRTGVLQAVDRIAFTNRLFLVLEERYDQLRKDDDLERLILLAEEETATGDSVYRARSRCRLARYLAWKFTTDRDAEVCIDRAIELGKSFRDIPFSDPDRWPQLDNLIAWYCLRHDQNGKLDDLNVATDIFKAELAARTETGQQDSDLISMHMLRIRRYEYTGNMSCLNEALNICKRALERLGEDGEKKAELLTFLADSLRLRYERTGNTDDLDTAITKIREAIHTRAISHAGRIHRQTILALCLSQRYVRSKHLPDLIPAIELGRKCIDKMQTRHNDRFKLLNNLGIWLGWSYEQTKELQELEECIKLLREALELAPPSHVVRNDCLNNLCGYLKWRYDCTGSAKDLRESILHGREAVKCIPSDHPRRALALKHLYDSLATEGDGGHNPDARAQAVSLLGEALMLESSPPAHRLNHVFDALPWLEKHEDWTSLSELTETATKLLPRVSPRSLRQTDQQYMLRRYAGLASTAAAAALQLGRSKEHALALLELGRGVITSTLLQNRRDITHLQRKHPSWAKRFEELRDALDPPVSFETGSPVGPIQEGGASSLSQSEQRFQDTEEFNKLLEKIRADKDFQNFLLPPRAEELMSGPRPNESFVIINVSTFRSDAFLIRPQAIDVVSLPELMLEPVKEAVHRFHLSEDRDLALGALEWLWKAAALPILSQLGADRSLVDQDYSEWPRVYWVPTGPLRSLPIHAAGYHDDSSGQSVLDRVISSYGLSVEEILYGREVQIEMQPAGSKARVGSQPREGQLQQREPQEPKFVLVSVEETPGYKRLPFAPKEAEAVCTLLPPSYSHVYNSPQRAHLLRELRDCAVFHFAGHGMVNPQDPSLSGLLLPGDDYESSGGGHEQITPLTVRDLQALRFQERQRQQRPLLAYLSACSTGRIEDDKLIDEGIHLMGACRLAGFRHVIGALWEVSDRICVTISGFVYESLLQAGMQDVSVAISLHHAIRRLRTKLQEDNDTWQTGRNAVKVSFPVYSQPSDPSFWAAFIHMGA